MLNRGTSWLTRLFSICISLNKCILINVMFIHLINFTCKTNRSPKRKKKDVKIIKCPWLTFQAPRSWFATVSHLLDHLHQSPAGVLHPLSPSPHPWRSCTSAKTAWDVFELWRRLHDSEIDIPPHPLPRQCVAILGLINVIDGRAGQQEGLQP